MQRYEPGYLRKGYLPRASGRALKAPHATPPHDLKGTFYQGMPLTREALRPLLYEGVCV